MPTAGVAATWRLPPTKTGRPNKVSLQQLSRDQTVS